MSDAFEEELRRQVCSEALDRGFSEEGKAMLCRWLLERLDELRPRKRPEGDAWALANASNSWERLTGDREHARAAVAKATGKDRRKVKDAIKRHPDTAPRLSAPVAREFCRAFLAGEPVEQEIYDHGMRNLLDRPTRQASDAFIWKRTALFYLSLPAPKPAGTPGRPLSEAGMAAAEAEYYRARGWREDRVREAAATMHGLPVPKVAKAVRDRKRRQRGRNKKGKSSGGRK